MKKKFLSVLLILTMVLTMIPMATGVAWADVGTSESNAWEIGATTPSNVKAWLDNGTLYIKGTGEMKGLTTASGQPNSIPWGNSVGSIVNVQVENGVTSIGNSALSGCSKLTAIVFPESVTSIGDNALNGCAELTSITVPASVTSIGKNAFRGCSKLTSITIPENVTSIGNNAFDKCTSLTNITIPKSITSIGSCAFGNCSSLATINFDVDSQLATISQNLFENCSSLGSITIPASVTSIENSAFQGCASLANIIIPSSVTSIGDRAFNGCASLTSITIPASTTRVGFGAFFGCSSLTNITIPASVTSIGQSAFQSCSKLATVTCLAPIPPTLGQDAFKGCASPTSIYVPAGYAFKYMDKWSAYKDKIVVTIADVLATVPGGFPTTAESGWVNEDGGKTYINSTVLKTGNGVEASLNDALTLDGDNYSISPAWGWTVKFIMQSGVLSRIDVMPLGQTVSYYPYAYKNPSFPSIGYFEYDVEKYQEILAEAQKQQAAIDAEIAPVKPGEEEKPVGTPITEEQAKALVTEMVPVVRTENQAKGIKVFLQDSPAINRFKAAGYKVLYDFYRAESKTAPKSEDYKITTVVNKEEPWYLNTAAKKGKRYYYKVVAKVYDAEGNLVGETELDQAAYGYRTRK